MLKYNNRYHYIIQRGTYCSS